MNLQSCLRISQVFNSSYFNSLESKEKNAPPFSSVRRIRFLTPFTQVKTAQQQNGPRAFSPPQCFGLVLRGELKTRVPLAAYLKIILSQFLGHLVLELAPKRSPLNCSENSSHNPVHSRQSITAAERTAGLQPAPVLRLSASGRAEDSRSLSRIPQNDTFTISLIPYN